MKYSDGDIELGERLRQLRVPEHRPGFFAELEDKLEAEAESRQEAPGIAPASRISGGRSAARTPRTRRSWLRLAWIPIPVALVILALLWAFAGPLGIDSFRPEPANAAEITQKALAVMVETKVLRCTQVVLSDVEDRRSVVVSADGSYRVSRRVWQGLEDGSFAETDLTLTESYDSQTGVLRELFTNDSGQHVPPETLDFAAAEATGFAAGAPDPNPSWGMALRGMALALRESSDATVKEGTYQGRPTWTLSSDLPPNLIYDAGPDHLEVAVDQETGFPVSTVYTREGQVVSEMHLEDLEINPDVDDDVFEIEFPADLEVHHKDWGFSRVELSRLSTDAADFVGYVPVLPTELPDGFVLTEVDVAEVGWASGVEGMNPPGAGVVSAMYRRGFDEVVVSTRLVGDDPSAWSDPFASGEGYIDEPETVTLTSGAFAGSTAEILISIMNPPHLWAMNDSLVVMIAGDLTRDELLEVAESLAPVE